MCIKIWPMNVGAIGLAFLVRAGLWSDSNNTKGFIPDEFIESILDLRSLTVNGKKITCKIVCDSLSRRKPAPIRRVDGGYCINNFDEYIDMSCVCQRYARSISRTNTDPINNKSLNRSIDRSISKSKSKIHAIEDISNEIVEKIDSLRRRVLAKYPGTSKSIDEFIVTMMEYNPVPEAIIEAFEEILARDVFSPEGYAEKVFKIRAANRCEAESVAYGNRLKSEPSMKKVSEILKIAVDKRGKS